MASPAEVKSALNGISKLISDSKKQRLTTKNMLLVVRNQLASIPSQYADEIATINGYAPDGPFESLSQDEKGKLQVEFQSLLSGIEGELDALGVNYS